ncbi:MAG: restriction endonuclease subunit S [Gemella haemolysans]|nr:restriction endonuclease subunit S [Gemella haemolysans]
MTNILELLKNEKVEWKKLGEVCEFINGFAFKSSLFSQSGEAVIRITNINSGKVTFDDLKYIKLDDYPELDRYKVEKNNILVAMSGATTGKIGYQYEDRIGYLNQRVGKFIPDESKVKRRFLFHFLYNIESELFSLATGSGAQPNLSSEAIKKIDIPIPSLEIQERIVKILDKFTNYVTELQSELQSRTKQYTYYRDKLLSEEYLAKVTKEMEEDRRLNIVQLEEVVTIKNGKDWKKLGQGNIPVYGSGGEMGVFVDKYSYDKPTVLIPRKGSIDNVFYLDKPFWNVDTIFHTEIDGSKLIPKYFYYFIEHYDLNKLSDNSTRPSLTQSTLNKLKIPLPPLSLQNKIVKVLDKFQILLSDTKGLIPEEIEQRQKQYEYYREKLLTFDVECDSTHAQQ